MGPGTVATPTWEALCIRFPVLPCPASGILNQVSEMALDGGLSQIELAPVQCLILGYRSDPFTRGDGIGMALRVFGQGSALAVQEPVAIAAPIQRLDQ